MLVSNRGVLVVALTLVSGLGVAHAAKYKASATEVAQLPRFCWAQYMDNVKGPGYEIPVKSCGYITNHYCPALVELIRANKSFADRGVRKQHLMVVRKETLYTLNGIKDFPACPIRAHVESTLKQVDTSLRDLNE